MCIAVAALGLGCGGPGPVGPGPEPTDTTEQTAQAGPKAAPQGSSTRTAADAGTAPLPDASPLPPQYDFDLIPRCTSRPQGSKTSTPSKDFRGRNTEQLIDELGLPSCIYHGEWRYELKPGPCPQWIETVSLTVSGQRIVDQDTYRRPSGISCR